MPQGIPYKRKSRDGGGKVKPPKEKKEEKK